MRYARSAAYTYDGDGKLVKAVEDGVTTLYVGAHYQVSGEVVTKYYFAGTQRIAMRTDGVLSYLLADHLGSTSLVTDAAGTVIAETRYTPYGETRIASGTSPTDYLYTSQRQEAGLGLYFYNARWYDPYLNQFSQPDTIVPNPFNPQSYNRYAYVLYNPIRYNDPSGHVCSDPDDPTPTCDGGGGYPPNQTPLPDAPVQIEDTDVPNASYGPVIGNNSYFSTTASASFSQGSSNSAMEVLNNISNAVDWNVQTPEGITLYKSPGYPYFGGSRIYWDLDLLIDNGSNITLGPAWDSIGPVEFGPSYVGANFETGPSSVGAVANALGVNIGNPFAPWAIDTHVHSTVGNQGTKITQTLGWEYIARPDNLTFVATAASAYALPKLPAFLLPLLGKLMNKPVPVCFGEC